MKFYCVVIMILVAAQPAVPAQSKAERDEALRIQNIEDQIASLYDRIQDLDNDRKDLDRQADEADNQAAVAEGAASSSSPSVAASARAEASAAHQRAVTLRARLRSDSDEIINLTRQIKELQYSEKNDGTPRRDAKPSISSDEPLVGNWKLNVSRSTFASDTPKSGTRAVEPAKGGVKAVDTATYGDGRTRRFEWTVKYDGKDYPIKGDGMRTIAISRASDHFFNFKVKESGRVTAAGQIVCSPDGKTQTMTGTATDAQGAQKQFVTFWDRQP
jgi:hypothetical protein